jgi:hypothetical protein
MPRSTSPSRQPAGPPATTAEAAAFMRDHAVKLYDRQDGQGVNWRVIGEALFRASFEVLDKLSDDEKHALARRVHAGSYDRLAGNDPASNSLGAGAEKAPSNAAGSKSPRPRPPAGSV